MRIFAFASAAVLAAAACGGDPADVAGTYTVAVTNGANGCMFPNYNEGDTAQNIEFAITQDGEAVTGQLGGVVGALFDVVLGSRTFTGEVDGSAFTMTLFGTTSATEGSCTWTINATIDGEIDGDFIEGTVTYRAATNGSPDCADIEGCATVQSFNGTRPPSQ